MMDSPAARTLAGFALFLLVTGFALSLLVSVIHGFDPVMAERESYAEPVKLATKHVPDSAQVYERVHADYRDRQYLIQAHAHVLNFVALMIIFGVLLGTASLSEPLRRLVVWLMIAGVLMYPAGLLMRSAGIALTGHLLAGIGATLIVVFVLVSWFALNPRIADAINKLRRTGE